MQAVEKVTKFAKKILKKYYDERNFSLKNHEKPYYIIDIWDHSEINHNGFFCNKIEIEKYLLETIDRWNCDRVIRVFDVNNNKEIDYKMEIKIVF